MKDITDEEIKEIIENTTLSIFYVGANKTNFKILKMLPTDLKAVMKELDLTKMPANARVNDLEKVGLVKRWKGTGKVDSTEMTKYFFDLMNTIKSKVEEGIKPRLLELN